MAKILSSTNGFLIYRYGYDRHAFITVADKRTGQSVVQNKKITITRDQARHLALDLMKFGLGVEETND